MLITIIIPCRNEVKYIESCLHSVLAFEEPPGGFEVIVADGNSEDGTRDILLRLAAQDKRLRIVDNSARTTPCALNVGIRAAHGEIIVRIDAHTEYAADYLCACVETLRASGADNVGGPWVARGTTYIQRAIAAAFSSPFAVGGARGHDPGYEGPVDTVYLGCWPREALEKIGGFDEELVRNQDDELNFRLLRAGGKIWQSPHISSWYTPRASFPALFKQYWQYGYWKVRVMQKHQRPASIRHLIPGIFAAALVLLLPASAFLYPVRIGLLVLMGVYFFAVLFASFATAIRAGWALLPVLPVTFACYHLGYGFGFLAGAWDFLVLRRAGRFVALTRK